ncbi:MAG: Mo-dependent nitrogenase C-terminal domain-containing protein [Synechococcales bacterium]|nr:Mo-dependent nitrogenase C-terminal domain-containing protein [Synechococcales bacterium]
MSLLTHPSPPSHPRFDLLAPLRTWLDDWQIRDRRTAHLLCQMIPCTCPFERTITLWNHIYHIPALCKLNPLYNEIVYLRLRALSYLSDICLEDVTQYIC